MAKESAGSFKHLPRERWACSAPRGGGIPHAKSNCRGSEHGTQSEYRSSVRLPVTLAEDVAADVEEEGHDQEGEAGGEDRLVADAVVGQVAQADLDDVGGDGGAGVGRVEGEERLLPGGDGDDHRLAQGAGDAQDVGGGDA